jgi:integrase
VKTSRSTEATPMNCRRIGTGRLTATELRLRSVKSRPTLKESRHPHAAAAEEQSAWLSWLDLGGASPQTTYSYRWTTDKTLALFPDTPFAGFTDVELLHSLKQFPPRSRPKVASVHRSWFAWGIRTRRITVNPTDFLPDFKKQLQPIVPVFMVEEEAALRALPEPRGTLMALLFDTGIRKAEARMLTAKRVDFSTQQLLVIEGAKGGRQRTVPIDQESAPFLLGRLDGLLTMDAIGANDYLWATRPGGGRWKHDRAITASSFHDWWVKAIEASGVTYRKLHTTRHTYATRWRQRGLDIGDIQLLLGHASIATTQQIYVHVDTEDVRKRMAALRVKSD